MWVIRRHDDDKYVAKTGSLQSYTAKLGDALVYSSKNAAIDNKRDNEYVVKIQDYLANYYVR